MTSNRQTISSIGLLATRGVDVQNRYTGDVGDFGKYGLLRILAGGPGEQRLRLGVVWWLVPSESHNEDGRYVQYLDAAHEERFRACDPELYDGLRQLVRHGPREVAAVREMGLLPGKTVFFDRLLSYEGVPRDECLPVRDEWCNDAQQTTEGCDLVFLDPDNGLATKRMWRGSNDLKHVFTEEIAPYVDRGQSVVVYHHYGRHGSHADQTRSLSVQLVDELGLEQPPIALRYRPWSPRAFMIIPAPAHRSSLRERVNSLLGGQWGRWFRDGLASVR